MVKLNLLVDENIPAAEHYLGTPGNVRRVSGRKLQRAQLAGVDVLLVRSVTRVDKNLLDGTAVKFVGSATSGIDHIDRDYLARSGIGFAHAPGANANAVVEYVLAAVASSGDALEGLLAGGTVGIAGYGFVGKAMAARLRALGIDYRVYDPWLDPKTISHPASLAQILDCDVVTLHPELTRERPWPSVHLLGAAELRQLRPGSLLINASRGPVVDNAALLTLLQSGRGPVTVLDVWEGEPAINAALLEQVTLGTPHIAGYSLDGKILATRMLCEALAAQMALPQPPGDSPAGAAPDLVVPNALSGAALVRYLLHARYDISRDDAMLRCATRGRTPASAGEGFDRLRKEYRERRELLGCTVRGEFSSPQDVALVRGLGCIPVRDGGVG